MAARTRWLADASANDALLLHCCGHGIWLPSASKTFLPSDFGIDDESVWPGAIALDDFTVGLAEKPPRLQWLIFDCCANTPPVDLRAAKPTPTPLLDTIEGRRARMTTTCGPLVQAVLATASPGSQAFGRPGGRSRFMDLFIEACSGSGFQEDDGTGTYWLTLQGLEAAMASYAFRVAPPQDEAYYTFSRVSQSDAQQAPRLMHRDTPAQCTLLITSDPALRLKECDLSIHSLLPAALVAHQPRGPAANVRFRAQVDPWDKYRIEAAFDEGLETIEKRAIPPMMEAKF